MWHHEMSLHVVESHEPRMMTFGGQCRTSGAQPPAGHLTVPGGHGGHTSSLGGHMPLNGRSLARGTQVELEAAIAIRNA